MTACAHDHPDTCCNCGRPPRSNRLRVGRCLSCYRYWRKHGHDRPASQRIRSPLDPVPWCSNCKQSLAPGYGGLCHACYQYKHRTGRNRPWRLWVETCSRCGRPKGEGFTKGLCVLCYQYRRKFGKDRPDEVIQRHAPHGYCDCGQPAVAILDVRVGGPIDNHPLVGKAFDIPLCADCLAIEESDY